ncbi:hypothetical protein SUGI_0865820 [Cryptomeria japonica]|nr:hypothetical protein SUGI_0865820 [Cryptomeria japonica]
MYFFKFVLIVPEDFRVSKELYECHTCRLFHSALRRLGLALDNGEIIGCRKYFSQSSMENCFCACLEWTELERWCLPNICVGVPRGFGKTTLASVCVPRGFGKTTLASVGVTKAFGKTTLASVSVPRGFGKTTLASVGVSRAFGKTTLASVGVSRAFGKTTLASVAKFEGSRYEDISLVDDPKHKEPTFGYNRLGKAVLANLEGLLKTYIQVTYPYALLCLFM